MAQLLVGFQHLPKLPVNLPGQVRFRGQGDAVFPTEFPADGFDFHVTMGVNK